jgi:hypothetical protein
MDTALLLQMNEQYQINYKKLWCDGFGKSEMLSIMNL